MKNIFSPIISSRTKFSRATSALAAMLAFSPLMMSGAVTSETAATPSAAPTIIAAAAPFNLAVAGTPAELISLERAKVDSLFGTPEQKQQVLRLFAADFAGISIGPVAPTRDAGPTPQKLRQFPSLPAGTFQMTDVHVIPLAEGVSVVTYICSGPGPDGRPWSAFNSSTWARRGAEWKTVYYQATVIPQT